jgi:hypothetical protein
MFAGVISVDEDSLLGNSDSCDGDVGSVSFQPFDGKVVDGVEAGILLELQLEVEAVVVGGKSVLHIDGQIVGVSSGGIHCGIEFTAWVNSVFDGRGGQRGQTKLVWGNSVVRHGQLGNDGVVEMLQFVDIGVERIFLSEGSSVSVTSSSQFGSRHNTGSKNGLIVEVEHGESVEDKIVVSIVLKSGEQLGARNIHKFNCQSFSIAVVLSLLIKSRKSQEGIVCVTRGFEYTHLVRCGNIGVDSEVGVNTTNGGEVESSSIESWKVSLRLESSNGRVDIIVHFVQIIVGKRRFLPQNEICTIGSNIASPR